MMQHILVVDDEPDISSFMQASLEDSGDYRVSAALGGEALSLLERDRPDLVILDATLSGSDGIAVVLEALGRGIPLLMTDDEPGMAGRMAPAGLPLLRKPFRPAELLAQVRQATAETTAFRRLARSAALTSRNLRQDSEPIRDDSMRLRHSAPALVERSLEPPMWRIREETAVIHAADAWALAMTAIKEAEDEQRFGADYQIELEDAERELYHSVLKLRAASKR